MLIKANFHAISENVQMRRIYRTKVQKKNFRHVSRAKLPNCMSIFFQKLQKIILLLAVFGVTIVIFNKRGESNSTLQ